MKIKVGIVTFPLSEAGSIPLSNLVKLTNGVADRVYLVSGGVALEKLEKSELGINVKAIKVIHRVSSKILIRIINYVYTQLKILFYVVMLSKNVNAFIFFIGGEALLIPLIALKILRKKVILMPGGVATKVYYVRKDPLSKLVSLLVAINFSLVNRIVVYSPLLIKELNVSRVDRVIVAHEHFVDFTKFAVKKEINGRANVVGYVGRLSEEKGILNLIKAIPLVLKEKANTQFVICGRGNLDHEVEKIIRTKGLEVNVKLLGWIPHEDIPQYLNEIKLLVLPSFMEGLPNILLEAMACGTPVLATSVGAVLDIIKEGKTGFLLKSNDPKHIAERIIELLNKPDLLERVSINAYNYVRENLSYEKTLEIWQKILGEL